MASSSISSAQSPGVVVWAEIQQQQAQRAADQAEQNARSLKMKARDAEAEALRAQEDARTTNLEYDKAENKAGIAKQNLVQMKSVGRLQDGFQEIRNEIASSTLENTTSAKIASGATSTGVTNAYGQQTGTLVNVTA